MKKESAFFFSEISYLLSVIFDIRKVCAVSELLEIIEELNKKCELNVNIITELKKNYEFDEVEGFGVFFYKKPSLFKSKEVKLLNIFKEIVNNLGKSQSEIRDDQLTWGSLNNKNKIDKIEELFNEFAEESKKELKFNIEDRITPYLDYFEGLILGFPECCIKAFIKGDSIKDKISLLPFSPCSHKCKDEYLKELVRKIEEKGLTAFLEYSGKYDLVLRLYFKKEPTLIKN